ncbi:reprolysin-like metallopeptidase [Dokdonella sp. MW10]|uniref:reprolysin-like metallopeptidase n=1 Tax=Dokdonella sp. MW10 TaxID=2992926 RepID=UPI003F80EC8F
MTGKAWKAGVVLFCMASGVMAQQEVWNDATVDRHVDATTSRTLQVDEGMLAARVEESLREGVPFALPHPEGGFIEVVLEDSGVMPPELAARFPQIRSLRGRDARGAEVRIDLSPRGFSALVFDRAGRWIVQPVQASPSGTYTSVSYADLDPPDGASRTCKVDAPVHEDVPQVLASYGAQRRTYRLAVAATGEFTQFHGGTVAATMAAITEAVNRVNGIYERELNIRLQLVANTSSLIYTNATTDPYTNNSGVTMLAQNQSTIDSVIGSANYDVGHVFGLGSGGVSGTGVVCMSATKARGVSGPTSPIGDPFHVDFFAHELGHQFGAQHTFNSSLGDCFGSRVAASAYEPGSGSTIMGFAGICGADNLQANADAYFHARSLASIADYTTTGSGASCAIVAENPNAAPVIDAVPAASAIPARTPFMLSGSASSSAGALLSYAWEQVDLGPAASLAAGDNGSSPLFRSWMPESNGTRVFPRLSSILAGTATPGETLPTTTRTLRFRFVVRDGRPGNARVTTTDTGGAVPDVALSVVGTAGPFAVTAPVASAAWSSGTVQRVAWNVAGTQAAPISCPTVTLALSADGGTTFAHVLGDVPNNGLAAVLVPRLASTQARVRAWCSNNVFFNISPGNFTIAVDPDRIFRFGFEVP